MQIHIVNTRFLEKPCWRWRERLALVQENRERGGLSSQHPKDLSSIYILPNTHSAPQSKHRAKTPK